MGGWWRGLTLVSDPEWDTQVVVVEVVESGQYSAQALGHVRDRDARNHHRLREVMVELFERPGLVHQALMPELPTFVAYGPNSLSDTDLEAMFRAATSQVAPAQLARDAAWLHEFANQTRRRLDAERAGGGIPPAPADQVVSYDTWWKIVSDPAHASEEWSTWAQMSGSRVKQDPGAQGGETATVVLPFNS
jgi:hypothetical protein